MHGINIIIKEVNKKLLSITLKIDKFEEKIQEVSIDTCEKNKKI